MGSSLAGPSRCEYMLLFVDICVFSSMDTALGATPQRLFDMDEPSARVGRTFRLSFSSFSTHLFITFNYVTVLR